MTTLEQMREVCSECGAELEHGQIGLCGLCDETQRADLPPDPEGMNDERADWADSSLQFFRSLTKCERDEAPGDLLANIMHWCDRNGMDFNAELEKARQHYAEETRAN